MLVTGLGCPVRPVEHRDDALLHLRRLLCRPKQNLVMEQRYEQLRRSNSERNEGLLEHTRGGEKNRL